MNGLPILSISVFLPLASALYIIFFVGRSKSENKEIHAIYVSILSSILTFISTIYLVSMFKAGEASFLFVEKYDLIDSIGLSLHLGVDGISVFFVFLTAFLTLICVISSLSTVKKYVKEFLVCFLLLESFCIGAFSSINLLFFYIFFEAVLIPMYIIIGVWGGENRKYAAFKFFLYTFAGSLLFLLSLIFIYLKSSTFELTKLFDILPGLPPSVQKILWIATFISFAVKIPIPPFHTWLPDAHVEAPTEGSVMLAGILLKLGSYALLRISLPMFPEASYEFSNYVLYISVFAIIYASLVAFAQKDMKKTIAYSSVAHMGYVTAGIFTFTQEGCLGALFQTISHALVSSSLFLVVGFLYRRAGTKKIDEFGGVAVRMPLLAFLFMVSTLGSIALPGTSGFIGEFLSLFGIFKINFYIAAGAATGTILGAVYMLNLYKKVVFGPVGIKVGSFKDINPSETISLAPLAFLIVFLGIFPSYVTDKIKFSVESILNYF